MQYSNQIDVQYLPMRKYKIATIWNMVLQWCCLKSNVKQFPQLLQTL